MSSHFIELFDIFSTQPELYIKSKQTHKSLIGGFLGSISMILILIFTINSFSEAIGRKTIFVRYNQNSKFVPSYNFTNIPMGFAIVDRFGQKFDNQETFFNIKVEYMRFQPDGDLFTEIFGLEKCTEEHLGEYKDIMRNVDKLDFAYCIPLNKRNLTIYGKYGSIGEVGFSLLNVFINKCRNTTEYDQCLDERIINKNLEEIYLVRLSIDYEINHNRIENPSEATTLEDTYILSTSLYKTFFARYRNVEYTSDYGILFSEEITESFFQFGQKEVNVDLKKEGAYPGSFSEITIIMDDKKDVHYRNFTKLQTVLANIGGIIKGIMSIANILMKFFGPKLYNLAIINKVFPTDEINDFSNNQDIPLKRTKFYLKLKDYFCLFSKNKRLQTYQNITADIKRRLSVETLLKYTYEIDRIKDKLLQDKHLRYYVERDVSRRMISNPIERSKMLENTNVPIRKINIYNN